MQHKACALRVPLGDGLHHCKQGVKGSGRCGAVMRGAGRDSMCCQVSAYPSNAEQDGHTCEPTATLQAECRAGRPHLRDAAHSCCR
eukprot:350634-Chlamydomonas_euryale.AAC.2